MKKTVLLWAIAAIMMLTSISCSSHDPRPGTPLDERIDSCITAKLNPQFASQNQFENYVKEQIIMDDMLDLYVSEPEAFKQCLNVSFHKYDKVSPELFMKEYRDDYDAVYSHYQHPLPHTKLSSDTICSATIIKEGETK